MNLRARVNVQGGFDDFGRRMEQKVQRALDAAAQEGAAAAQAATRGRFQISVSRVRGTQSGWAVRFGTRTYYGPFHDFGTLGNRKLKLKRPEARRRTGAPGTGIEPLRFGLAGKRAGLAALWRELRR